MTTPIPELTEQQLDSLESKAEAKVYRALRDQLPADYTVFFRVGWILRREDEPEYYAIVERFYTATGLPCLINTSFNMHEEPIVCTPGDALRAFKAAGLPRMILGPFWVSAD